jgi:hypothetical protein
MRVELNNLLTNLVNTGLLRLRATAKKMYVKLIGRLETFKAFANL